MACYMCDGRAAVITTPRVGSIKYGGEPVKGAPFRQACLVCRGGHQAIGTIATDQTTRVAAMIDLSEPF